MIGLGISICRSTVIASGGSGVPVNIELPTIGGTATVGENLSAAEPVGLWTIEPTSYAVQWYRCDADGNNPSPIAGADQGAYTLQAEDLGFTIRLGVIALNGELESEEALSAQTAVVAEAAPRDNTDLQVFTVNGSPVNDGDTVTLANGTSSVTVVATPVDAGASAAVIGSSDSGLVTGDNTLTVTVTAADLVTTRDYHVTLHVQNAGAVEITDVVFSQFASAGFIYSDATHRYGVWFNDGVGSQPDWSAQGVTDYSVVFVNTTDSSPEDVAAATVSALGAGWSLAGTTATFTDPSIGVREDAVVAPFGSNMTITVTQQGAEPA